MKCKCGCDQFFHFDDFGRDYNYCAKCNRAYDDDGNEIPDGPEGDNDE